jgi:anti-sigma factor RsiW
MECRYIRMSMPAFLDGDLAPAKRCVVEEHLAECPACATELEALNALFEDACVYLECPEPVPAFAVIRQQLDRVEPIDEVMAFLPRLKIRRAVPRFVVAALLLLFAGGGQYLVRGTWQMISQGRTSVAAHRVDLDARLAEALDPHLDADRDEDKEQQV